jgi:hypothetical protein
MFDTLFVYIKFLPVTVITRTFILKRIQKVSEEFLLENKEIMIKIPKYLKKNVKFYVFVEHIYRST